MADITRVVTVSTGIEDEPSTTAHVLINEEAIEAVIKAYKAELSHIAYSGSYYDLTYVPNSITGYGIEDAYTKGEVDNLLSNKVTPLETTTTSLSATINEAITNYGTFDSIKTAIDADTLQVQQSEQNIQEMSDEIHTVEENVSTSLLATVESQKKVETILGNVNTQATEINNALNEIRSLDSDTNNNASLAYGYLLNITNLKQSVDDSKSIIDTNMITIANTLNDITELRTNYDTGVYNISASEAEIKEHWNNISTSENNITQMYNSISDINSEITNIQQDIVDRQNTILSLQQQTTEDADTASQVLSQVETLKASVDEKTSQVVTINDSLQTSISTINAQVETTAQQVVESKTYADNAKADADTVNANKIAIEGYKTSVEATLASVNELATQVANDTKTTSNNTQTVADDLAIVETYKNNAKTSEENAKASENNAKTSEENSQSILDGINTLKTEIDTTATTIASNLETSNQDVATTTTNASDAKASADKAAEQANLAVAKAEEASASEITAKEMASSAQSNADKIASSVQEAKQSALEATASAETAQAYAEMVPADINSTLEGIDANITDLTDKKIDEAYVEEGFLVLRANGNEITRLTGFGGGGTGGGGSTNEAVLKVTNTTGWLQKTISNVSPCEIKLNWSSIEDETPTGSGTVTVTLGTTVIYTKNVEQGDVSIDIKQFLEVGTNKLKVKVEDTYSNTRSIAFTVTVVAFSLTSRFSDTDIYTDEFTFPYTPYGNASKTIHILLDGTEITDNLVVTTSGRTQYQSIPKQSHGMHKIECYFTALLDGQDIQSETLYYEFICVESGNETPIVASSYVGGSIAQYSNITIPYMVYTPNSMTSNVVLKSGNKVINTLTSVGRTEQEWNYFVSDSGDIQLSISVGDVTRTIDLNVSYVAMNSIAETQNLNLYLTSYGRSNYESNPAEWKYNDISATFTGFSFIEDGWVSNDDNITVLRVTNGNKVEIPYMPFENDARVNGMTLEFEFLASNIFDYDAPIISCMSGNRGVEITGRKAILKSAQTTIETQFKEEEDVRVSFVIESKAEHDGNHRFVFVYINGICSGFVEYPLDDDFSQTVPVNITIGSEEATVDIYNIRIYGVALDRYQVCNNWVADTADGELRKARDLANDVYDEYGNITIAKITEALPSLPYMVLEAEELPQYKGDKKTISGYYVNPVDTSRSFSFEGASANVQGTSSQYYVRKNYKITFKKGFLLDGTSEATLLYSFKENAIPVDTFTFKADVASSEGANNVELIRLYNDLCPYKTPPQELNENVRQGIDGFPMVMFWKNGDDITFLGKYNFNNDKSTSDVFGLQTYEDGTYDESWETLDNTLKLTQFLEIPNIESEEDLAKWAKAFEARYPENNVDYTNLYQQALWIKSTDTTAATNNALETLITYGNVEYKNDTAEYRLAKFKNELAEHFNVSDTIFYYVFTLTFLMIDSRVKNSFPTVYKDNPWCWLPYDADTANGINNEGALVFGYNLEDTDKDDKGADVYNGQSSVMWNNVRMAFPDEIKAEYQRLRSSGLSYETVEERFETHQSLWSAAIFNEDAYYKYVEPLLEDKRDDSAMCQGSKAEQRKYWLWNRFRYLDSKFATGDAQGKSIGFRAYAISEFDIVPYSDMYIRVKVGSSESTVRAEAGKSYHLTVDRDDANDTESAIYSADQIQDCGDLSGFQLGTCDFSTATRLQRLQVGSETNQNLHLTSLTLGNNYMLKYLDVRNCPNLTQAINASNCSILEEVYFQDTGITGISLPSGNTLKKLYLPATVTNLTVKGQQNITDFNMPSYSQIAILNLENVGSSIPIFDILNSMSAGSRVRLAGFEFTASSFLDITSFLDVLDTMKGIDSAGNNVAQAEISGTIYTEFAHAGLVSEVKARYPYLNVEYTTDISDLTDTEKQSLTPAQIDQIIRGGLSKTAFEVGDTLTTSWKDTAKNLTYNAPMIIVGFGDGYTKNGDKIPNAPIVQWKYALPFYITFGGLEAMYRCDTVLKKGTYCISTGYSNFSGLVHDTTYNFTLTEDLAIGTLLAIYQGKLYAYADNYASEPFKIIYLSEGADGTLLFTLSDTTYNNWYNNTRGTSRYSRSLVRKYLNSDKLKKEWWYPTNKYDLYPTYTTLYGSGEGIVDQKDGFLSGFSEDFLNIVGYTYVGTCRNSSTYDDLGTSDEFPTEGLVSSDSDKDITFDRFYLPSVVNMYYSTREENVTHEGPEWEYWQEVTGGVRGAEGRLRTMHPLDKPSTSVYCWTRSYYYATTSTTSVYCIDDSAKNQVCYMTSVSATPTCILI